MSRNSVYAVDEDNPDEQADTPISIHGATTAGSEDDEFIPSIRMTIGPAALDNGDYAQAWVNVSDGQTFNLLGWGLIDSNEDSPDGLELVLMQSDTEVESSTGVVWEEPDDPIASIDGPANVFIQLVNNTGDDLDSTDDTTPNWAAGNFDFEVK